MFRAIKEEEGRKPCTEDGKGDKQEIGGQAVWSLSTAKPGFGVDQLRDDNLETYWQSDGAQPHLVNVQFAKKSSIEGICIYSDYKLDESYTPARISVKAGTTYHDLQEVKVVDIEEPIGWITIPLIAKNNQTEWGVKDKTAQFLDMGESEIGTQFVQDYLRFPRYTSTLIPLRANFIQLLVLANHQNGRDTHIRQIKVYGPRQSVTSLLDVPQFTENNSSIYSELR